MIIASTINLSTLMCQDVRMHSTALSSSMIVNTAHARSLARKGTHLIPAWEDCDHFENAVLVSLLQSTELSLSLTGDQRQGENIVYGA